MPKVSPCITVGFPEKIYQCGRKERCVHKDTAISMDSPCVFTTSDPSIKRKTIRFHPECVSRPLATKLEETKYRGTELDSLPEETQAHVKRTMSAIVANGGAKSGASKRGKATPAAKVTKKKSRL